MWQLSSEENSKRVWANSTTGGRCAQTMCYTDKEGNHWWEFDNLMALPFTRSFAATKIASLYQLGLTKEDLNTHTASLKALLKSADPEKYEKAYAQVLDFEGKAENAADPIKQISSLVCVYYTMNDEAIDSFENDFQIKKMSVLEHDPDAHGFFLSRWIETTEDYTKHLQQLSQIVLTTPNLSQEKQEASLQKFSEQQILKGVRN